MFVFVQNAGRVHFKVESEFFRVSDHDVFEDVEDLLGTGPSFIDISLFADSRKWQDSFILLAEGPNDIVWVLTITLLL